MKDVDMDVTGHELLSLGLAAVFGAGIGLEREIRGKPVGLRTNILICLGACVFTVVSRRMGAEFGGSPVRMAAHIVGGIGFLGAGAIIRNHGTVQGATTAATIWLVASVGVATGAGLFVLASVTVGLALFILLALNPLEQKLIRRHQGPKRYATPEERYEESSSERQ
jgi:putative Mg2+ transporter-C (MgtC) family protein